MGLELLFQGSNIERLLNGLWVTAEIAFRFCLLRLYFRCHFWRHHDKQKPNYQSHLPLLFRICTHHSIISVTFFSVISV